MSGQTGHRQLCGTMFVSGRDFIIRSLKSTTSPERMVGTPIPWIKTLNLSSAGRNGEV